MEQHEIGTVKDYVKTEIFPREMGRKISQTEEIRHASDYDDFMLQVKQRLNSRLRLLTSS